MSKRDNKRHSLAKIENQYDTYLFEHMEHMENYNVEASALHRKLQSKTDALRIMRQELQRFRTERDQFKLMAETLQLRYSSIRRHVDIGTLGGKNSVASLLDDTRERNLRLTTEVEALKQKLNELQGDMELLRGAKDPQRVHQIQASAKIDVIQDQKDTCESEMKEVQRWKEERADFISHLENLKKKNAQLSYDLKALIDEKEEIIMERDAFKCKAHRLNHELVTALKANEKHPKFLDVDSIVLENKYLYERIKNIENELDLAKQSASKYKSMLEAKRKRGIIKLGSSSNEESILSHKQAKKLLESGIDLPTKTETIQDLKSLCLTLLDNLNDKTVALNHQKKTNKLLATKIAELEQRVQSLLGLETSASSCSDGFSPSLLLLNGYCPSMVDTNESETSTANDSYKGNDSAESSNKTMTSFRQKREDSYNDDADNDAMSSSVSTESARSILSSEYGLDSTANAQIHVNTAESGFSALSEFTDRALLAYATPSSTTDSGGNQQQFYGGTNRKLARVPEIIQRERMEDLKDLPPELASLVQKALYELDLLDFERGNVISTESNLNEHHAKDAIGGMNDDDVNLFDQNDNSDNDVQSNLFMHEVKDFVD